MNKFPVFNVFATVALLACLMSDIPSAIIGNDLSIYLYGIIDGGLIVCVTLNWFIYFIKK